LACESKSFRNALAELWAKPEVTPEDASHFGNLALELGAIARTQEIIQKEVAGAIDCLGHLAYTQGGERIIAWLERLSHRANA
jgi:hypothetical protein